MGRYLQIGAVLGLLAVGVLAVGLAGGDGTGQPDPEKVALRRQIEEIQAQRDALRDDFARYRQQAGDIDATLGRVRNERTQLDLDYKTALAQQKAAEESLTRTLAQLADKDEELNRLRREVYLLRSSGAPPNVDATHPNVDATHLNVDASHLNVDATHLNVDATHLNVDATHLNVDATPSSRSSLAGPRSSLAGPQLSSYDPVAPRGSDEGVASTWRATPGTPPPNPSSPPLRVRILKISPDRQVIALGYTRRDGAQERQRLVLSVDGRDVATVVLTALRGNFSVGMILPGSAPELLQMDRAPEIRVEQ